MAGKPNKEHKMKKIAWALSISLLAAGAVQAEVISTFTFTDSEYDATGLFYTVTSELYAGSTGNLDISDNHWEANTSANNLISNGAQTSTGILDNAMTFNYTVTGLADDERLTLNFLSIDFEEAAGGDNSVRFATLIDGVSATGNIDPATSGTYNTALTEGDSTAWTDLQNGDVVAVSFTLRDGPSGPATITYDNLYLDGTVSVIPEPATIGLLGVGTVALLAYRRRKHD
jgi:hypothetical protein